MIDLDYLISQIHYDIRNTFEVEDGYYIEDGFTFVTTYNTKLVKMNGKPVRTYPYLVPTETYTEYLNKLKDGDKK